MEYTSRKALGVTEILVPSKNGFSQGFVLKHSAGVTLARDPAHPDGIRLLDSPGHVDISRFSWKEKEQLFCIREWADGTQRIILESKTTPQRP
jgi:hypothetical protein